jgi:hypothetical protein
MKTSFTLLAVLLVLFTSTTSNIANAERNPVPKPKPITGSEQIEIRQSEKDFKINPQFKTQFDPVRTKSGTVLFSSTPVSTVYDLQANGVPQEIWQDPITPSNVHAVFMYSFVPGFASRGCAYFFSNDFGAFWNYMGDVPSAGRSGFPAISGLVNGAAVIANHNNTNGSTTHTKINYDQGPGFGVFTAIDPGTTAEGDPIWARVLGLPNNNVLFVSAINGQVYSYTNKATNISPPGTFSGYQTYPGDQAEAYSLALSPNGTVGHAFIGSDLEDPNDVFYRSSADGGLTWTPKQRIWDWNVATDSLGCLRGVNIVFGNNNQPYIAFSTSLLTESGFFPALPSQIRVWSPAINGGIPVIVASDSNVPFYANSGSVTDAFLPICRPSIGRAYSGNAMFVAFTATTAQIGADSSSYFAVWSTHSLDQGNSWIAPERLTPSTPLRDWRFVSVSPTNNIANNTWTVQMVCQSDSLAGTHVNGAPIGRGELVGIRYVTALNQMPSMPLLVSPSNGSTNVFTTPLLDWSDANATSYRVQVSTDSLFASTVVDQSNVTSSQYRIDTLVLNHNTKYFWRVNGTNNNGTGPWSLVSNFRTITQSPLTPVLTSPANGAVNVSVTPLLDWETVINANTYRAQIARDSNFSSTVFDQSGITQSQVTVPSSVLNHDTTYYWKISGQNSFGSGQWSSVWKFRTLSFLPAAPILLSPANGSFNVILTPSLSWTPVTGASSYRVEIATDSLFLNIVTGVGNLTTTIYTVPASILSSGTRYYWRVNATNTNGTGLWSASWSFTTFSQPFAPQLTSPLNGADSISLTTILDWENVATATTYRFLLATDSAFSSVILDIGNLSSSQYTVPSPYLTYMTRYYWKVNASNTIGAGPWSVTWNFRTRQIQTPSVPVLVFPANNTNNMNLTPTLDWQNSSNAFYYKVNLATDLNFNGMVLEKDSLALSQYMVPAGTLSTNTLYFWRVLAYNPGGSSAWSSTFVFRTFLVVGTSQLGTAIPEKYELYNNYPNPFNPVTKIRFDLPKSSSVRILLYDITGKVVMNLVDGELQAGSYETTLDASSLSSGLYFYRMETPDFSNTKRLMLIK